MLTAYQSVFLKDILFQFSCSYPMFLFQLYWLVSTTCGRRSAKQTTLHGGEATVASPGPWTLSLDVQTFLISWTLICCYRMHQTQFLTKWSRVTVWGIDVIEEEEGELQMCFDMEMSAYFHMTFIQEKRSIVHNAIFFKPNLLFMFILCVLAYK